MRTVILNGARTPIGKLAGALSPLPAAHLGAHAVVAALARSRVPPDHVDRVILGQVLQAGAGQNSARQVAVRAGIPLSAPAMTINKVCLSGLAAIHQADLLLRAGEARIVVAGGMESMTNAPHLLPAVREGVRFGDAALRDAILVDGLTCAFEDRAMGAACEDYSAQLAIGRDRQDAIAASSHQRAAAATRSGRFASEIAPITVPQRRGDPVLIDADEGIIPGTDTETLSRLRPAFARDGTITAGNASQLSDGAVAVVLCSLETAEALGVAPLAELVSYGEVAGPDPSLLTQPSRAIRVAAERVGIAIGDLDVLEINEAFAAVVCAAMDDLGVSYDVCNPNGGAIALGHPIGMSGARVALTLALELAQRGGLGAAGVCGGGGQGDALVLRAID